MLNFKRLDETNVAEIIPFVKMNKNKFCDWTVGVKFMWRNYYVNEFAVVNGTLILKESCEKYETDKFYYPVGRDVDNALREIENYAAANGLPLEIFCIDGETAEKLKRIYPHCEITSDPDWDDYIYDAQDLKTFGGKKYSGQRNHLHRFLNAYPDYNFEKVTQGDIPRILDFLKEYENEITRNVTDRYREAELDAELVKNFYRTECFGGYIEIEGRIAAVSFGEITGDTLVVHIEKGLKDYPGVYQAMVKNFAQTYATDGIRYINREEDCGDEGLRISKSQYHPIEKKVKYTLTAHTLFDGINQPVIKTERLTLREIQPKDKQTYFRLYTDDGLNRMWGYDYRQDLNGATPSADYFYGFQNALKAKKEEFSFAVCLDGEMIGEVVLHNFDFRGGAEIGHRILAEYQNRGYGTEAFCGLKNYAFAELGALKVKSRCYKENVPSEKLIKKAGLHKTGEDETYYYFEELKSC